MKRGDSNKLNGAEKAIGCCKNRSRHTYDAKDETTVWTIKNKKNPVEIGGVGNQRTVNVAIRAKRRRGINATSHGRSGLSPLDHFAASQPPMIWNGKSMRTTSARSSRLNPFSTSFNEVTASLTAKPIFATRCIPTRTCTSEKQLFPMLPE